ncbi:unnamed protein product [Ceutorhynchus assimilis]|uniref:Trehalase n=1 Tax=Ceutorhynchus assimilis TaxID=467358 RepID=A0A9N9MIR4_9CUCU|nr:unnamed protein product [Ceutorhynchus assimilis]
MKLAPLPWITLLYQLICHTQQTALRPYPASEVDSPFMAIGRGSTIRRALVQSCSDLIFCQGALLDTVQRQGLYKDSKRFVDMSLKHDQETTLKNFRKMMSDSGEKPSKAVVRKFVEENFEFVSETESWTPTDFNQSPTFLNTIKDTKVKKFAKSLVSLWPLLGRRIKDSVKTDPKRHSLIPVPEGFIVPGGRFREIYYWDSYWIIEGLLISEMKNTAKGMLTNLAYFIKNYGFIPNGSRVYYLNRSQPPLFTMMVGLYMDYTNDQAWLASNVEYIEKEMMFWLDTRTLTITKSGSTYQLAHYGTRSNTPRPESYAEDLETCKRVEDDVGKQACYNALKTACETGWDFSLRWIFDKQGGINSNLSDIDSQRVVPADLNAFLCTSFRLLSGFYGQLGNSAKQTQWAAKADLWQKNMETVLYNEADGIWYDYDYNLGKQRKYFFPSNLAPLWTGCYDKTKKDEQGKKAVEYLKRQGIDKFMGGIPTSLQRSGEQWDLPNAWPPLQEFVVLGLYNTGNEEAKAMARDMANRWLTSNMKGFEHSKAMYEKYDAVEVGEYGGGGEYAVQLGFGWTNGVALSFIKEFHSNENQRGTASRNILSGFFNKYSYIVGFSSLALLRAM